MNTTAARSPLDTRATVALLLCLNRWPAEAIDERAIAAPLLGDKVEQGSQVASGDGAQPGRLSVPDGERELPFVPAQLKSQVQTRAACGTVDIVGRCHDGLLGKED